MVSSFAVYFADKRESAGELQRQPGGGSRVLFVVAMQQLYMLRRNAMTVALLIVWVLPPSLEHRSVGSSGCIGCDGEIKGVHVLPQY